MKVYYKKLDKNAKVPVKSHPGDFCYDVWATSREEIAPGIYKYGIGLAFEIDRGDGKGCVPVNPIDIDVRPRSSVWKTGLSLCNCVGTVDEPYRGEVMLVFYHVMPNMPIYEVGDRIGQIKLGFTVPMDFEEREELGETERGAGGFGSTGIK